MKGAELAEGCIGLGFGFDGVRELLINDVSWSGHAHNGILQATLSAGLLGMLALLAGWYAAVRDSLRNDRGWNMRVLSLNLYLFLLAMIGPIFDSPSYFSILLFVIVLYGVLQGRATRIADLKMKKVDLSHLAQSSFQQQNAL
jgi:hypothetical protein